MIIRPEVLPEEYARGYQGRVMKLNRLTDPQLATRTLMKWCGRGQTSGRDFSTVELLATVAGMDVAQFAQAHTVFSFRRAVDTLSNGNGRGCRSRRSTRWSAAITDARAGAYLCTRCVEEDVDFHGMSYWRREHQLPGLYSCPKHGGPLGYVETRRAFLSPPSAFYDHHHVVDGAWVEKLQRSAPTQRYLSIAADLLARAGSVDERDVSRAARARAIELGLHTGRGAVARELISDRIKTQFDPTWLASVIPGWIEKLDGKLWPPVDGALFGKRSGISSTVYAIVFASLFESSDQAINAMLTPLRRENTRAPGRKKTVQVTDRQLRDAYIECRGCHSAVERKLGLSRYVTSRRLQEAGLPSLGNHGSDPLRKAVADVLIGRMSIDDASKSHNIDRADLERLLIRAAAPFGAALAGMERTQRRKTPRRRPVAPPKQRPGRARAAPMGSGYRERPPIQNVAQ